jgi:hypothetical protein
MPCTFSCLCCVVCLRQEAAELGSAAEVQALHAAPSQRFCGRAAPPLVCAHGGDTSAAPPNTAEAFQAALDAGALCVEVWPQGKPLGRQPPGGAGPGRAGPLR